MKAELLESLLLCYYCWIYCGFFVCFLLFLGGFWGVLFVCLFIFVFLVLFSFIHVCVFVVALLKKIKQCCYFYLLFVLFCLLLHEYTFIKTEEEQICKYDNI